MASYLQRAFWSEALLTVQWLKSWLTLHSISLKVSGLTCTILLESYNPKTIPLPDKVHFLIHVGNL